MDRNNDGHAVLGSCQASLSARRAWIEISLRSRLGGVEGSLSARRAWIEMEMQLIAIGGLMCRSPQGERG